MLREETCRTLLELIEWGNALPCRCSQEGHEWECALGSIICQAQADVVRFVLGSPSPLSMLLNDWLLTVPQEQATKILRVLAEHKERSNHREYH